MRCTIVIIIALVLSTVPAVAGDRTTWHDIRNNQTRYNSGKQWVVIKETYCMVHKHTAKASYSTRYYVYEDSEARYILNDFKPSRNRHAGVIFQIGLEDVGYFTDRMAANAHMKRTQRSDSDWNRRLH